MNNKTKVLIAASIIILAAASRLVKHPYNFTPIIAMSLFAGCYLKQRWGILLPLVAMLISDYIIGFYHWQVMVSVYLSIALAFVIGSFLAKYLKWYNVIFSSLISSLIFFVITNFSVWVFFDWYAHSWQGLVSCFTLALPFFRNSLAGDLFYTGLIFGLYHLAVAWLNKKVLKEGQDKYGKVSFQ
jgi:signal transduction histidine kinase